jgi:glycosyltransferase involved in cell wall biosynthesis
MGLDRIDGNGGAGLVPKRRRAVPAERAAPAAAVAVVLVHWNQPRRLRSTVVAFRAQSTPVELLVVDNGSAPTALAELPSFAAEMRLLEIGSNRGFGPAANVGLRWWLENGRHEYLVVAPHDALPAADCLERMFALLAARPRIGLACADLGDAATPIVDPYLGGILVPSTVEEGWEAIDYPHGTLMMARRDCLLDIGLFDERYFAYGEEIDLGMRARAAGWEVGIVRGARVRNPTTRVGAAAVDYLQQRNTLQLVRRYSGRYHAFIRFNWALAALASGLLRPSARPALFSARARARALFDFLRDRSGPPPPDYFETLDAHGDPVP